MSNNFPSEMGQPVPEQTDPSLQNPLEIAVGRPRKLFLILPIGAFIIISLILIVFKMAAAQKGNKIPVESPTPTVTPTNTVTPTPQASVEKITVVNGNIVLIQKPGETKTLINKEGFPDQAITRLAEVNISPDRKRICFLGYAPGMIWLYWANIDGTEITMIGQAKNCVWSYDSQKIAYNNYVTGATRVDVYIYYLSTQESKNLTKDIIPGKMTRFYDSPYWSKDDQKITAQYEELIVPREDTKRGGVSVIDLDTGKITDFEKLPPHWPY